MQKCILSDHQVHHVQSNLADRNFLKVEARVDRVPRAWCHMSDKKDSFGEHKSL